MPEKYKATFMLTTFPDTIGRAASLISMADGITSKDQETLLGCAILLLAIALDQALITRLREFSEFYASIDNPPTPNPADILLYESFKKRILRTPEINPTYPARINTKLDYIKYLLELVEHRNELMHFAEEVACFDIDLETNSFESELTFSDQNRVTATKTDDTNETHFKFEVTDPARGNPWKNITIAEARRDLAAVTMYTEKVLWDPGPCEMLIPLVSPSEDK